MRDFREWCDSVLITTLSACCLLILILIALNGDATFVESNPFILYTEIAIFTLFGLYGLYGVVALVRRLYRRSNIKKGGPREN